MATATSHPLTTREALSGIWGSISLCAWIFLLVSLLYSRPIAMSYPAVQLWMHWYTEAWIMRITCYLQLLGLDNVQENVAIRTSSVRRGQRHIEAYLQPSCDR